MANWLRSDPFMKGALLMVAIAIWCLWMAFDSLDPNWRSHSWPAGLVALMPPMARFAFHSALALFCGLVGIGLARIRLNIDQIDVRLDAIRVKSVLGWREALWADVDHILFRATSPFPAIAVVRKNPTFMDHLLLRSRFGVLLRPDSYDHALQQIPPQYKKLLHAYPYSVAAAEARPMRQLQHVVVVISLAIGGVILRHYNPFAFKMAISVDVAPSFYPVLSSFPAWVVPCWAGEATVAGAEPLA